MATRPDRRVKAAKKPVVPKKRGRGGLPEWPAKRATMLRPWVDRHRTRKRVNFVAGDAKVTREHAGGSVLRALADFPLDGRERFIPRELRLAFARTWSPGFSPSTLLERCGRDLLEWPRFQRVLATLAGFKDREDSIGRWARAERRAIEAALQGKPLTLKRGDPLREILQAGVDDWLLGAFNHLTVEKGLSALKAYEELAGIRRSNSQAIAQKLSKLQDVPGTRRRRPHERARRTVEDRSLRAVWETFLSRPK